MVASIRRSFIAFVAIVAASGTADAAAQDAGRAADSHAGSDAAEPAGVADPARPDLGRAEAMIMLDYQVIPVPQEASIDLLGFHVLGRLTDSLYVGVGALAPLVKGEYGGFMAFDVTAHAQRRIWRNLFADAGVSLGGGGGGRSKEQSKILSGTGGFVKAYLGLGWDFDGFSVGANAAAMKFRRSAIDHTQLNVFVQVPFSYTVGAYASSGQTLAADDVRAISANASENTLTWGLDNLVQIDPRGSNKSDIRLTDLQFAHYLTRSTYWYADLGVGYQGLRLYNQLIGGVGYRWRVSPRIALHGQLGLGSGGWAPDRIDTGSGLLVYPKAAAEFSIAKNFGIALTAGYLFAPTGSSKNTTFGASLNYHIRSGSEGAGETPQAFVLRGYRFSVFAQSETNVRVDGVDRARINLLSGQFDTIVGDHVYIPVQVAVAYDAYLGYPGYGEILAGVGVQDRYAKGDRFQFFGQLLAGTNAHGAIVKPGIGMNVGLDDRLALHASAGRTIGTSSRNVSFRSDYFGLGLTYRFSVPSW